MGLDALVFSYPEFTLKLKSEISFPERGMFLGAVPVEFSFPSGHQAKGALTYDTGKGKFFPTLTDFFSPKIDFNDPNVDRRLIENCNTYRLEISRAFEFIYGAGLVKESVLKADS
ncbi:hypothetical protein J4219_01980 [Candidatus Woesearchaeota archaeon]|nr:hypothetical protein [Candidatus Woesearchaeota archaeon]